jgi:hypothetical protein
MVTIITRVVVTIVTIIIRGNKTHRVTDSRSFLKCSKRAKSAMNHKILHCAVLKCFMPSYRLVNMLGLVNAFIQLVPT